MINRNFDIYARKRGFFKISTNNKTVEQIVDEVYTHIMMEQWMNSVTFLYTVDWDIFLKRLAEDF